MGQIKIYTIHNVENNEIFVVKSITNIAKTIGITTRTIYRHRLGDTINIGKWRIKLHLVEPLTTGRKNKFKKASFFAK